MEFLLKRLAHKSSLIRAVILSAAGTGILCFTTSLNRETTVAVSLAPSVRDLAWLWKTAQMNNFQPTFTPLNFSQHDAEIIQGAAKDASTSKHPCNCFSIDSIANATAKVGPAVVNLSIPQGSNRMTIGKTKSVGSGTIIDEDGTILTCAHVVVDFQGSRFLSKGKIEVKLQDGRIFEGIVVNADLHSDIALVKIKSKTPLPTAKLGSSSEIRPGDWVVAMGCPHSLQNTATAGIISCVDRKSSELGLGGMQREYLQTDCAVYPGNSGGPLVNIYGEIIGVHILKLVGTERMNFAVPIDYVTTIIEQFKRNGRVVRTWLGMKTIDLDDKTVAQLKDKIPAFPNIIKGVLVSMVYPGSPADRAGFQPADIVVEFGGSPIGSIKEVVDIMGDKVGEPFIAVVKRRNDVTKVFTVIPEEADPDI